MPRKPKTTEEDFELEDDLYETSVSTGQTPFAVRFLAAFLILVLILLSVEGIEYFIHPSPSSIPSVADIHDTLPKNQNTPFSSYQPDDLSRILAEAGSAIKQVANRVASASCKSGDLVCQSKALFLFVRDNITYVPDPKFHDQLENPLAVLRTGGADCEDMAVLVGALEQAIGNDSRLVFIPGHAYVQVRIPGYKRQWISLEPTCKTCKFGEVPTDNQLQPTDYQDL